MSSQYTVSGDRGTDGTPAPRLRALGRACTASGLAGIAIGALTLGVTLRHPEALPGDQWSYPFDPTAQWVVSGALAVTHLLTLAGFLGVVVAGPHARSRPAAVGLWAAVVGYAGLAVCELLSGAIATARNDSPAAGAVSGAFAVTSLLSAAGSIVAGVVVVRRCGLRTGWSMVLWSGVVMVVLVTPANVTGDPVFRMTALSLWSLTFVFLGQALVHTVTGPAAGRTRAPSGPGSRLQG